MRLQTLAPEGWIHPKSFAFHVTTQAAHNFLVDADAKLANKALATHIEAY